MYYPAFSDKEVQKEKERCLLLEINTLPDTQEKELEWPKDKMDFLFSKFGFHYFPHPFSDWSGTGTGGKDNLFGFDSESRSRYCDGRRDTLRRYEDWILVYGQIRKYVSVL